MSISEVLANDDYIEWNWTKSTCNFYFAEIFRHTYDHTHQFSSVLMQTINNHCAVRGIVFDRYVAWQQWMKNGLVEQLFIGIINNN